MRMLMVAIPAYGTYFYISMPIVGRSMSPQFNPQFADFGDTAFLLPRIQPQGKLHRGRVYVFTDPSKVDKELAPGETEYLIKRCIALEGDHVMVQRNDKLVEVEIPPGHVWMESDNHNFQSGQQPDSLAFGPIPLEDIWGRVILCVRRKCLFDTILPDPRNYERVPVVDALPHQRLRFNRDIYNNEWQRIQAAKNLPNKADMTLVPKGPADLALKTASIEEKQGYANRHKFTSSDNKRLDELQKKKNDEIDQLQREKIVPGTPITTPSKPANQSQYPNLT